MYYFFISYNMDMKKLKINIFIFIIVFCIFLSFYFIYIINKKAIPVFSNYVETITKWKDQLETQYLYISQATSGYGRAYICSPCTAGTAKGVQRNVQAARFYMWYAFENMEVIARAPHAYLPILLSDKLPAERALALRFGLELLEQSDMVFVCGKLLSTGMKGEIARAVELSIPIIVYDAELYLKVRKLVTRYGGDKAQVKLHNEPCYLSLTAEEILA